MQIKVATNYDDLINGPFLEMGGGSKKKNRFIRDFLYKTRTNNRYILMIGTFSGMGGAKKNSP